MGLVSQRIWFPELVNAGVEFMEKDYRRKPSFGRSFTLTPLRTIVPFLYFNVISDFARWLKMRRGIKGEQPVERFMPCLVARLGRERGSSLLVV